MTTAQELPHPPAAAVGREPPARPALAVVPNPTEAPGDFDDMLRRAAPRLKRFAIRRLRDPYDAEEVVQEALLRGYQHRHRLATEDDLMAWLTVVTGRLAIDRIRLRARSTPVADPPTGGPVARDTADVVVARHEARLALDALEAMPARQAAVLWAREVEGLSYDAISDRFALSEPSVRSLLHRARRTLRREYADRGGTVPTAGVIALLPAIPGLHALARLRQLGRRFGPAAVAATGLAVATVLPVWTSPSPAVTAPTAAPPLQRAVAVSHAATPTAVAHHATATTVAPTTVAAPGGGGTTPLASRYRLPTACSHGIGAGCGAPNRSDIVYVPLPLPVAGKKWVGVSTTIACGQVPTNPVTACDQPQKGSN
jgi:RNA polymerase sigma-70 factor, ECF subfamily